jgi:BTB/POZ domain
MWKNSYYPRDGAGNSTYFTSLLFSPFVELNEKGEFFIDRCGNGFDRILEYMSTGDLSTE